MFVCKMTWGMASTQVINDEDNKWGLPIRDQSEKKL